METIRSFSCGRGVHRFFVFDGFKIVKTGYISMHRGEMRDMVSEDVSLWGNIKARMELNRLERSDYFWETTNVVKNHLKGAS